MCHTGESASLPTLSSRKRICQEFLLEHLKLAYRAENNSPRAASKQIQIENSIGFEAFEAYHKNLKHSKPIIKLKGCYLYLLKTHYHF